MDGRLFYDVYIRMRTNYLDIGFVFSYIGDIAGELIYPLDVFMC